MFGRLKILKVAIGGSEKTRHTVNCTVCCPWSATFLNMMKCLVPKSNFKKINVSDDLLISPVSYDEVFAFLLLVKARNSRLLTGRIICLY